MNRTSRQRAGRPVSLLATIVLAWFSATVAQRAVAASCQGRGVELQVLGSGGPELVTARASTSYLVWRDGKPRVLVDSGGGSALRFAESGARVADLDVVLFSHFHVDHSADFAALVKSSYFQDRHRPLPLLGPAGNDDYPGTKAFMAGLFDANHGSFRYLSDYLPGAAVAAAEAYTLQPRDIEQPTSGKPLWTGDGIVISAASVVHGNVPALAWRIDVDAVAIVFSGDTDGRNGALEKLAHAADLLVAHNAIPETAAGSILELHMPPSRIGRIAAGARVRSVVLSHRMQRSLGREDETRAAIATAWKGPLWFADDLDCFRVSRPQP